MHYDIVQYAAFLRFAVDGGHRFEHRWWGLQWRREAKGLYPQCEHGLLGYGMVLKLIRDRGDTGEAQACIYFGTVATAVCGCAVRCVDR